LVVVWSWWLDPQVGPCVCLPSPLPPSSSSSSPAAPNHPGVPTRVASCAGAAVDALASAARPAAVIDASTIGIPRCEHGIADALVSSRVARGPVCPLSPAAVRLLTWLAGWLAGGLPSTCADHHRCEGQSPPPATPRPLRPQRQLLHGCAPRAPDTEPSPRRGALWFFLQSPVVLPCCPPGTAPNPPLSFPSPSAAHPHPPPRSCLCTLPSVHRLSPRTRPGQAHASSSAGWRPCPLHLPCERTSGRAVSCPAGAALPCTAYTSRTQARVLLLPLPSPLPSKPVQAAYDLQYHHMSTLPPRPPSPHSFITPPMRHLLVVRSRMVGLLLVV
jgi:hypothetical protein